MIFVTVGTHEQSFNRLIKKIDELRRDNIIEEEVFIQIGYSSYEPQHCKWKRLLSYKEIIRMYEISDIIITHGGPASFMKALEFNKTPIVVPRQEKFNEHINNHQVEFVKLVEERFNNIILVDDLENLEIVIKNYHEIVRKKNIKKMSGNEQFNKKMIQLVEKLEKKLGKK